MKRNGLILALVGIVLVASTSMPTKTQEKETITINQVENKVKEAPVIFVEEPQATPKPKEKPKKKQEKKIAQKDLELMARLINAEAGADYCSDDLMYYTGSVVLNRVASKQFPNTIEEVIYQKGQYACITDGNFDKKPSERAWRIAEKLLKEGSKLPKKVIFQAEFKQGKGVYLKEQNMYFCYN